MRLAMLSLFLVLSLSALSLADTPLPPPKDYTVYSPQKAFCAEVGVESGIRVYSFADGRKQSELWSMKGWYRNIWLADDGKHLVIGYDGMNLIPVDYTADMVMITFVREGTVIREVKLKNLITDFRKLVRTVSHYYWGSFDGFDKSGNFAVTTVENKTVRFDITTGELAKKKEGQDTPVSPT